MMWSVKAVFDERRSGLAGVAAGITAHGMTLMDLRSTPGWNGAVVDEFVVATDARRREVYWAHYSHVGGQFQRLHGPFVTTPADVTPLPVYGADLS